jgi:acetylornithine aminotransferase
MQSGLFRTGKLWAHHHFSPDIASDILTMAKPLANGFPVGATMVSNAIAEEIKVGDHGNSLGFTHSGTTFRGNPLAARLAHHVFQHISSAEMLTQIHTTSALFQISISYLKQSFLDLIEEVRGLGLILGVQLKAVGGRQRQISQVKWLNRQGEWGCWSLLRAKGLFSLFHR